MYALGTPHHVHRAPRELSDMHPLGIHVPPPCVVPSLAYSSLDRPLSPPFCTHLPLLPLRSPPLPQHQRHRLAMASRKRKRVPAPSMKPQFFKILLPCFLQRLRLPKHFNKYIAGCQIRRKATVVSPDGKPWTVEAVRDDEGFSCFDEGWREFAQAHDLDVGYLVLFTYYGGMVFTATIFDRTTCMKECASGSATGKRNRIGADLAARTLASEELESGNLRRAKSARPCFSEGSHPQIHISSDNPSGEPSCLPLPQEFVKYFALENSRFATLLTSSGESWCVKVSEDSEGFHFGDGWQRFAVAQGLKKGDSIMLKHKVALVFDAAITHCAVSKTSAHILDARSQSTLSLGENTDQRGMEEPAPALAKRMHKTLETPTCRNQSAEVDEAMAHDSRCKIKDVDETGSKFEAAIDFRRRSYKYRLEIPAKFSEVYHLSSVEPLFLKDKSGRLWSTTLKLRKNEKGARISSGWNKFFLDNGLRDGDVCTFELKEKNVLLVEIQRKLMCQHSMNMPQEFAESSNGKFERYGSPRTAAELVKTGAYHRAGRGRRQASMDLQSCRPVPEAVGGCVSAGLQFAILMHKSHIFRWRLEIPRRIASSSHLSSARQIFLLDQGGRRWPVVVLHHRCRVFFGGAGWRAFCVGNNVELGDMCIFKLASATKMHFLHVSVIKG